MLTPDQDHQLKLKCMEIAADEMMSKDGFLKAQTLMARTRQLYEAAKIANIDSWPVKVSIPESETPPASKEEPTAVEVKIEALGNGLKVCIGCGEEVPEKFKKHKFKKDGSTCGYVFKEEGRA